MNGKKLLLQQIAINLLLALIIVKPSLAVLTTESSSDPHLLPQVLEYEPPPRGAPGDRGDGGSRDPSDFLVMIPATNWGLTAALYPTFWLYMPMHPSSPIPLEFVLREMQEVVYRTTFKLTQEAGMVSFRLPETAPSLEIGKKYNWFFSCGNITRHGWIERVVLKPELSSQLETATRRERILLFAKHGLWHETLTELVELRRQLSSQLETATSQERLLIYAENGLWYEALTELAGLSHTTPVTTLDADWAALMQHPFVRLNEIVSKPLV